MARYTKRSATGRRRASNRSAVPFPYKLVLNQWLLGLFNAPGGRWLYVENLKGATGEIALRVGDNEPFGVINVGDDARLCKLCEDYPELTVAAREFSGSLFHEINKPYSRVNLLIGSKKFTEGWNSWRVSTMGLMNVGATEGSQIIQLFGRGVRLKGYDLSLKRSGKTELPEDVTRPRHIGVLETLSIFGIRADYMAQFRDFLAEEGLPTNDERIEILLPVIKNLGTQRLKTIHRYSPGVSIPRAQTPYGVWCGRRVRHHRRTPMFGSSFSSLPFRVPLCVSVIRFVMPQIR